MKNYFSVEFAVRYGVEEAVLIDLLHELLGNDCKVVTLEEIHKQRIYIPKKVLSKALEHLIKEGVLVQEESGVADKVFKYAFSDKGKEMLKDYSHQ